MEKIKLNDIVDIKRIKNLVPGTLVYRGKQEEHFSIELFIYDEEMVIKEEFSNTKDFEVFLKKLDRAKDKVIWINITGLNAVHEIKDIGTYFDIPLLLLEQILHITKHSIYKFEENYIFSDLQMIYMKDNEIEVENVSIYTNENVVMTFQEKKGDVFDSIRDRIKTSNGKIRTYNSDYLYYCILDALVDNYLDVMEKVKYDINIIEEEIINEERLTLRSIHDLRKLLLVMRLTTSPFEKLVEQMKQNERFIFANNEKIYIENLYYHIKELVNEVSLQREMVNALFENYMLNNGNEMNKVMTTLTIFSAVFIPLSFFAGVFGMNFQYIPGLDSSNGFYLFVVFCIVMLTSMIGIFKLKKWF